MIKIQYKVIVFVLLITAIAGCTQEEKVIYNEADNPYVQPIEIPKINLDDFELEYTSIKNVGKVTLMFQKDNITQINHEPNDVLAMKSRKISTEEFESLVQTVEENKFFLFKEEEYGEFSNNNGPAYVLDAKFNGEQNIVSCQLNCPQEIKNIMDKVQTFIE